MEDQRLQKLRDAANKDNVRRDEVHEASDSSFPASDPPAFTSAKPTDKVKWAKTPEAPDASKKPD